MPQDDTLELQAIQVAINKQTLNIANIHVAPTDSTPRVPTEHKIPKHTKTLKTPGGLQRTRHYMAHDTMHEHERYTNKTIADTIKNLNNIDTPTRSPNNPTHQPTFPYISFSNRDITT